MATITWINTSGGLWSSPSNWSSDTVPGSGDDVFITTGNFYTLQINDAEAAQYVDLNDPTVTLELKAGTLALAGALALQNGLLKLDGGTLQGGTIADNGGAVQFAGGTLSGVTWQGPLDIGAPNSTLTVIGGLTLRQSGGTSPGTLDLIGNDSTLWFRDSEVLDNVTFDLGAAGGTTTVFAFQLQGSYSAAPLTFGPNAIVNVAGSDVIAYTTFTNAGLLAIEAGATLDFQPEDVTSFSNTGSISIAASGTLSLGGRESLSNLGSISSAGGVFQIGDGGILDLAGGTLTIANGTAFENVSVSGGHLQDGTIVNQSGTIAMYGALDHITWDGPLNLGTNNPYISGGLVVRSLDGLSPGTLNVAGFLTFLDSETLSAMTLNLAGYIIEQPAGGNLTFDTTTPINLQGGTFQAGASSVSGGTITILGALNDVVGGQFNNGGQINDTGGNGAIQAATFFNSGTVSVGAGNQFSIDSSFMLNSGLLTTAGTVLFQQAFSSAGSLAFNGSAATIVLDQPSGFNASISGWARGDVVELVPAATYTFDPSSTDTTLVIDSNGSKAATLAIGAGYTPGDFGIEQGSAGNPSFVVLCFARGTRISAENEEVAVEDLRVGDVVRAGGSAREITWVGHRHVNCARHPTPEVVWPVRVSAGAFGPSRPHRDLWLSPDHAVYVLGVLIPVKYLINGDGIARMPVDEIDYYHVELPRHDILLAEGLPVESYLETGGRANFANGATVSRRQPNVWGSAWETGGCAPLIVAGEKLAAARCWTAAVAQPKRLTSRTPVAV
jgi:hypothetical protein